VHRQPHRDGDREEGDGDPEIALLLPARLGHDSTLAKTSCRGIPRTTNRRARILPRTPQNVTYSAPDAASACGVRQDLRSSWGGRRGRPRLSPPSARDRRMPRTPRPPRRATRVGRVGDRRGGEGRRGIHEGVDAAGAP
jgi:hypothetical protein